MNKLIIIILCISINAFCQSDWSEKYHYKEKGADLSFCGKDYPTFSYNDYGNPVITGYAQKCKVLIWTREFYFGYMRVWNGTTWDSIKSDNRCWKCEWIEKEVKLK